MTTSMYISYVGFDYTYIGRNVLAQGIISFLASQVWFQTAYGARTYGTDSPAITNQPPYPFGHPILSATDTCMYVYVCLCVCMCVCMYVTVYLLKACFYYVRWETVSERYKICDKI